MNTESLKKLEALFQRKKTEKPEKGFHTRQQYSKLWRCGEQSANRRLRKYVDAGLMEIKYFKIRTGLIIRPVPHYRIKHED